MNKFNKLLFTLILCLITNTKSFCIDNTDHSNDGHGGSIIMIIVVLITMVASVTYEYYTYNKEVKSCLKDTTDSKIFLKPEDITINKIIDPITAEEILNNNYLHFIKNLIIYSSIYCNILLLIIIFYYINFLGFKDFLERFLLKLKLKYPIIYKYRNHIIIIIICSITWQFIAPHFFIIPKVHKYTTFKRDILEEYIKWITGKTKPYF